MNICCVFTGSWNDSRKIPPEMRSSVNDADCDINSVPVLVCGQDRVVGEHNETTTVQISFSYLLH